jgi:hypothetical protein
MFGNSVARSLRLLLSCATSQFQSLVSVCRSSLLLFLGRFFSLAPVSRAPSALGRVTAFFSSLFKLSDTKQLSLVLARANAQNHKTRREANKGKRKKHKATWGLRAQQWDPMQTTAVAAAAKRMGLLAALLPSSICPRCASSRDWSVHGRLAPPYGRERPASAPKPNATR